MFQKRLKKYFYTNIHRKNPQLKLGYFTQNNFSKRKLNTHGHDVIIIFFNLDKIGYVYFFSEKV